MKTINEFKNFKASQKSIKMVTCYDYWSAKIIAESDVDVLLVGDSVSMVVHGFDSTVHATPEMMATHTAAVHRAQTAQLIVTDLPFLVHRSSKKELIKCVDLLMKAGAQALKIEAAPGQHEIVEYLSKSGVPMIGHVGLTPQYVNQFGGYKVQGKELTQRQAIIEHSILLEQAGCHAIVLECVPNSLAEELTEKLEVPTIGIGAGESVNGQVLVLQDLLGFNVDFQPRFVRKFADGNQWMQAALNAYTTSVNERSFPTLKESFL